MSENTLLMVVIVGFMVVQTNCVEIAKKPSERSVRIRGGYPQTSSVTEKIADKPVVFPQDDNDSDVIPQAIPESLLISMRNFKNVDDFLNLLGPNRDLAGPNYNGSQEGGVYINGSERDSTTGGIDGKRRNPLAASIGKELAQAAGCEIEMQAVELDKPDDPSIVLWPSCTRLPRCGGCCSSSLLECVPTKVTKGEIKILKARYTGKANSQFEMIGMPSIKIEKHEKCECQCRQKPEHCTPLQTYKREECKCVCENELLRKSCKGAEHVWDSKECVCKCKQTRECSTGFFYSVDSCQCEVVARSSRIGSPPTPPRVNPRRGGGPIIATRPVSTSSSSLSNSQGVGDFGQPMSHLNAGERSKLDGEVHVNIKPYDTEPFTLAQTRRASRGRPVVRVPVKVNEPEENSRH